jgi:hypothetical protein
MNGREQVGTKQTYVYTLAEFILSSFSFPHGAPLKTDKCRLSS